MTTLSFDEQIAKMVDLLGRLPPNMRAEKDLIDFLSIVRDIPRKFYPADFAQQISSTFTRDVNEIKAVLDIHDTNGLKPVEHFDKLVPKAGWLHDYIEYTRQTEPPTVFHFFAGASVIGATLARNVALNKGSGDLYPNLNVVLIAPSGKCKKTTACNIAVNLYRRIGGNVLADKITPEAIIDSFKSSATATGLIYAPEWSVFLGKQQYMEGLVPMLTALFDCPEVWSSATIMRQTTQLHKVALSHLAASTIDWVQTSISKDAFGGGFMSRLLFVVQHDTDRRFPMPPPLDAMLAKRLTDSLLAMQHTRGAVTFMPDAYDWYVDWYMKRLTNASEKHFAGYSERKPDRLLQLATILTVSAKGKALELDIETLDHSNRILSWIEQFMPSAFSELSATTVGDDQHRLLRQIRSHNGELGHSEWLRMNTSRMNADTFRKYTDTLIAAKCLAFDPVKRRYHLLPPGWAQS